MGHGLGPWDGSGLGFRPQRGAATAVIAAPFATVTAVVAAATQVAGLIRQAGVVDFLDDIRKVLRGCSSGLRKNSDQFLLITSQRADAEGVPGHGPMERRLRGVWAWASESSGARATRATPARRGPDWTKTATENIYEWNTRSVCMCMPRIHRPCTRAFLQLEDQAYNTEEQ